MTFPAAGLLGGAVAVLLAISPTPADGESPQRPPAEKSSGVWRDLEWKDLDGRTWTADDLLGRIVLVDFWATWCAPCLAELPTLRGLRRAHGEEDLVILGVALDAIDRRRLRSFLGRQGILWPQIHVPRGVDAPPARRFEVRTVPTLVVVDAEGRLVARNLRGPALRTAIEALLDRGRQAPTPP